MNRFTSNKKWLAALLCLLMLLGSTAGAQTYRNGDEADEIATIQTALAALGMYSGSITGHFGNLTESAVKIFQKRYALTEDGIVGEDTLKALYEAAGIDGGSSGSSSSSRNSKYSSIRVGRKNSEGGWVNSQP